MPTTRPRHVITETDDVSAALADAAQAWPEAGGNAGALLRRLVQRGHESLRDQQAAARTARLEALATARGALTGDFGPDYLQRLREDWPA